MTDVFGPDERQSLFVAVTQDLPNVTNFSFTRTIACEQQVAPKLLLVVIENMRF